MTDDLLKRAEPFLNVCGACDLGMPTLCNCPTGDSRPVMLDLVREVERLRALVGVPCAHGFYRFQNCGPCSFDRALNTSKPLISDETLAEVAAMEERDRLAGGAPWEVPDHPDHGLPGGWHRGQIR